jgi:hypothetical protein
VSVRPVAATARVEPAARPSPWSTVLPFAVLLAYVNGFWVTALRGAVGSTERTTAPFTNWLRDSTLLLPLFVLAVLVALSLAARGTRHGWGVGAIRPALLVALATTAAGTAHLVADSIWSLRLQLVHLDTMGSMGGLCTGSCLDKQYDATVLLQVRAVALGSLILLASNVVAVFWLLALRGGRLAVRGRRTAATEQRRAGLPTVLAAGLLGAAAVHAAVVPEHFDEWTAAGGFFVLLTVAEVAAAVLMVTRRQWAVPVSVAVSAGPLLLWLWSRTLGMPFGPEPWLPEAVGLADLAACALELTTLVLAVALTSTRRSRERPPSPAAFRMILVAVLAVTAIGFGSGAALFGDAAVTEHGAQAEVG